jgi:hypothetical protein
VTKTRKTRLRLPLLPAFAVDALPQRWWAVGNLHFVIGTSRTWHFCVGPDRDGGSVRTIELGGRILAWGRRPFDYEQSRLDGERLAVRQEAAAERRFGPVE